MNYTKTALLLNIRKLLNYIFDLKGGCRKIFRFATAPWRAGVERTAPTSPVAACLRVVAVSATNIISLLKLGKFQSKGNKLIFPQKCGKMHTISSWQSTWESYQKMLNYEFYCQEMKKLGRVPKDYHAPTGIPQLLQHFTPHQLRHTYCTMLYHAGIDALRASKLMGHSNVQITLDIYTHLEQKYKTIDITPFNDYVRNDITSLVIPIRNIV